MTDIWGLRGLSRAGYRPLLEGGVKIYEYQPTMFHLKTMVVDGIFSTVGSANFDDRSFHLNEEINLFVYDATFAGQMKERLASRDAAPLVETFAKPICSKIFFTSRDRVSISLQPPPPGSRPTPTWSAVRA